MRHGRHAILVGLIAALALMANLLAPFSPYDGGLSGAAGAFVLHGQIPYRDFWWLYGPASPGLVAVLTSWFGPSVLLLRVVGLALAAVQAAVLYSIIRDRAPHVAAALIAIGAVGAASFLLGLDITSWSLGLTIAVLGLWIRIRDRPNAMLAGLLVGTAFASRLDIGAYALLAGLLVGERRRFTIGFAVIALPVATLAIATTPLVALWEQLVLFPVVGTRQFRAMPLPDIDSIASFEEFVAVVIIPKITVGATLIHLLLSRGRPRELAVIAAFALLCQLQTLTRADIFHQAQAAVPAFAVFGWLSGPTFARIREPLSRRAANERLASLGMASLGCAVSLVVGGMSLHRAEFGLASRFESQLIAGTRTVIANTGGDDPVFVGLTNHRITLINDQLVYYLANRRSAVHDSMFNPGVTNTDTAQAQMAAELAANRTTVLLLDAEWADAFEPSNASAILGSTLLDRYLRANYVEACAYGPIHILTIPSRLASLVCVPQRQDRLVDLLGTIRPDG